MPRGLLFCFFAILLFRFFFVAVVVAACRCRRCLFFSAVSFVLFCADGEPNIFLMGWLGLWNTANYISVFRSTYSFRWMCGVRGDVLIWSGGERKDLGDEPRMGGGGGEAKQILRGIKIYTLFSHISVLPTFFCACLLNLFWRCLWIHQVFARSLCCVLSACFFFFALF